MKVGIIAPIKFLGKYCITNIQYCLPDLICGNKEYREFYVGRERIGDAIILDCRKPTWKREPADFDIVKKALSVIRPTIMVSPSYMFNTQATINIFKEFKKRFRFNNIIGCLESTSKDKIKELGKVPVGVPSHMYRYALEYKWHPNTIFIENNLHLEELDNREGILVTSLPIKLGLQGRLLSDYLPSPPSLTYYEVEDKYPKITMQNIKETIEHYRT